MKTIEERAIEWARENGADLWGISIDPMGGARDAYITGYEEAIADSEQLLCEIDNLHNLVFWDDFSFQEFLDFKKGE